MANPQEAIKLAMAIRQVESGGNYDAKGLSGESGAYQFIPSTWQKLAQKHLTNPQAEMTPEAQNEVATREIYDLMEKGHSPREIALIWNGGQPVEKKGVNKFGVAYDSGRYADKVTSTLSNLEKPIAAGFDVGVDNGRKQGKTDTELLDLLSTKNPTLKARIDELRQKAQATDRSDREVLNYLSKKLSGKEPTVPSVSLDAEKIIEREQEKGFFQRIEESGKERLEQFGEAAKRTITGQQTSPELIFQTVGQGAGFIGDIIGEIAVSGFRALPDVAEEGIKEKGQAILDTQVGKLGIIALRQGMEAYGQFKEAHPRAAANIESAVNIATLFPGAKGAQMVGKPVVETTGKIIGETTEALAKRSAEKATAEITKISGMIAQGKKADIPVVLRALQEIETSGIKTYQQFRSVVNEQVGSLSRGLDSLLEKVPGKKKLNELAQTTKIGGKTVSFNFVDEALKQLDELYRTVKDPVELEKIIQLKTKAKTEGLSVKEINMLARQYGNEFGKKAFSKTGDALTSINAQAFENTRKGVKKTARNLFGDKIFEQIDDKISDLIRTRELAQKMEENVNKIAQRVQDRGILERFGRRAAIIADLATGKFLSGLLQRLIVPRGQGFKVMNALDIENALKKNLDKLQKLLDKKISDEKIIQTLENLRQ